MAILGILVSLGVGNFATARQKARDAKRKSDLSTIAKALEAYANDHNGYPLSDGGNLTCAAGASCAWGGPFTDENGTIYAATLPQDENTSRDYYYDSDTQTYTLYAALENENDPAIVVTGQPCGPSIDCNYQIISSNLSP